MDEAAAEALLIGALERFSPSGDETAVAAYLRDRMRAHGFRVEQDAVGNIIGSLGDGPRLLMLVGHIDTVIGQIPVRKEGDRLYGRGAVDAKGPCCAFIAAAARLGPVPGWRLVVVGAVGEEAQSPGARHLAETWPTPPDFLIIGEPSGWSAVTLGYKGSVRAEISVRQTTGHSAGPVGAVAEVGVAIWNRIAAAAAARNENRRVFDQLTPVLREFHTSTDGFTDAARLSIGFRIPLDMTTAEVGTLATTLADGAEVRLTGAEPPFREEKTSPLVRAFLPVIRAHGGEPGLKLKTGTADINILAPRWGCPAVAYGAGDSSLDHTPDEHIVVPEYHRSVSVLVDVLRRLTASD